MDDLFLFEHRTAFDRVSASLVSEDTEPQEIKSLIPSECKGFYHSVPDTIFHIYQTSSCFGCCLVALRKTFLIGSKSVLLPSTNLYLIILDPGLLLPTRFYFT